jgi:hypothetical protein
LRDLVLKKMWDCSARRRLESFDLAEIFGNESREINQSINEFLVVRLPSPSSVFLHATSLPPKVVTCYPKF